MLQVKSLPGLSDKQTDYVRHIERALTLEELDSIQKPEVWLGLSDIYLTELHRIMRRRLSEIKTPQDVLACHEYFANSRTYSREIQIEFGEKAREIFSKWIPPGSGAISIRN